MRTASNPWMPFAWGTIDLLADPLIYRWMGTKAMERSRHALMEVFLDMEGDSQAEVKLLRLICEVIQDQEHALEYVKGRLAVLEASVRNLKEVTRG